MNKKQFKATLEENLINNITSGLFLKAHWNILHKINIKKWNTKQWDLFKRLIFIDNIEPIKAFKLIDIYGKFEVESFKDFLEEAILYNDKNTLNHLEKVGEQGLFRYIAQLIVQSNIKNDVWTSLLRLELEDLYENNIDDCKNLIKTIFKCSNNELIFIRELWKASKLTLLDAVNYGLELFEDYSDIILDIIETNLLTPEQWESYLKSFSNGRVKIIERGLHNELHALVKQKSLYEYILGFFYETQESIRDMLLNNLDYVYTEDHLIIFG